MLVVPQQTRLKGRDLVRAAVTVFSQVSKDVLFSTEKHSKHDRKTKPLRRCSSMCGVCRLFLQAFINWHVQKPFFFSYLFSSRFDCSLFFFFYESCEAILVFFFFLLIRCVSPPFLLSFFAPNSVDNLTCITSISENCKANCAPHCNKRRIVTLVFFFLSRNTFNAQR